MINCGIIGFGKMGRIRAKAIQESGMGQVVVVWDAHPVDSGPYRFARNEEEILNSAEIHAVFICTPNYRIVPLTKAALAAGKHVFSEKPPAFTATELKEVLALESSSGCKLMYGFNHRHHGSIQKMKSIIESGEMGKVLWMRGRYGKEVDESFFKGWRADPKLSGGGIMLDQGIHMLDLFLFLGGGFDEVHAFISNLFWKIPGVEDNVFAILRSSETGVCASLHSTMTQWRYLFSLEVFLERGALVLNGLKTSSGVYGDEDLAIKRNLVDPEEGRFEEEERLVYHTDTSWGSEVRHFLECVMKDQAIRLGNSCDAMNLMTLLDKIYQRK
jgi:1,5-anhydro-D-fructose reductase (1,5-anhydro-D-mannitol-forming)